MPDRIETVKKFTMGAIGWVKTTKGAGMAGIQAVVSGALMQLGFESVLALALGACVSTAVTAVRQFIKTYKIVRSDR